MSAVLNLTVVKELAQRETSEDEIITLYWDSQHDMIFLDVYYNLLDSADNIVVPNDRALDAFYHPHAYL